MGVRILGNASNETSGRAREGGPRSGARARAPHLRFLVIEGYPDLAEALQLVLAHHGHAVEAADSGRAALRVIETFCPDVVLLDLHPPDCDGYALADQLRRHPNGRHAAFIALTGWGRAQDSVRIRGDGFAGHIIKPFVLDDVLDLITSTVWSSSPAA